MREIKFRGLDIITGDWFYGSLIQTAMGLHYIYPQNLIADAVYTFRVDKKTVGQYTGLKDKNGVEIYEGDIVSFAKGVLTSVEEKRGCVIWDEKEYVIRNECGYLNYPSKQTELWGWREHIEVIGNIYENPNLLKGESK